MIVSYERWRSLLKELMDQRFGEVFEVNPLADAQLEDIPVKEKV